MALLDQHAHETRRVNSFERIRRSLALWQCLLALTLTVQITAQEVEAPEPRVKAAFLYNFTKLVSWPTNSFTNSEAPIVIGVLGKDPLGPELDQLEGLQAGKRTVAVAHYDSVAQATNCHILFISSSERRRLDGIFDALENRPVLTVGDTRGFESRGMIELVRAKDKVDLRINWKAANASGLRLSSRLTRLDKRLRPLDNPQTNSPPAGAK